MPPYRQPKWWAGTGGVLLLLLMAASGCGERAGSVEGTVTFQGKPLSSGSIVFYADDDQNDSGHIADGKYTVGRVPVGDVKVVVMSFPVGEATKLPKGKETTKPGDPPPAKAEKFVPIPAKYSSRETTDLKYKITGGSQKIDIDLKP
jgi:hypothetical protein